MKKKTLSILIILCSVFSAAMIIVVLAIMFLFPNAFNGAFKTSHEKVIFEKNIEVNHISRMVSVSCEINHNEEADNLKGYWIKLIDPDDKKEIDKIFIKRRLAMLPDNNPEVIITPDNQVWVIQPSDDNVIMLYDESGSNHFEGFAALIKINGDKFEKQEIAFLKGWTIIGLGKDHATLRNLFNQHGCLDYTTHAIVNSICEPD